MDRLSLFQLTRRLATTIVCFALLSCSITPIDPTSLTRQSAIHACPIPPPQKQQLNVEDHKKIRVKPDQYKKMLVEMPEFHSSTVPLPWHFYTPQMASKHPSQTYPLVISLHGGYGREVEDGHVMVDGAPYLLGAESGLLTPHNRKQYPAFILMPHCRQQHGCEFYKNEWASNGGADFTVNAQPSDFGQALIELIEHVLQNYPVDIGRVYLTGVSMGGGGTWDLISRRPDLIAAAVPMAGHTPAEPFLDDIARNRIPIWAMSSNIDLVNSHLDTDQAINRIVAQGGCAWVTKFDDLKHGHALWQRAFLEPGLWHWLFSQRKLPPS